MIVRMIRYTGTEPFWNDRASTLYTSEHLTVRTVGPWLYGHVRRWAVDRRRILRLRHARRMARWRNDWTRCGRRDDMIYAVTAMTGDPQPRTGSPRSGQDLWIRWPGTLRTCDYCGSLHPEDAIAVVKSGRAELESSDKNYKAYLQIGTPADPDYYSKAYRQHFTPAQWKELFVEAKNLNKLDTWAQKYRQDHQPPKGD